MAEQAQEDPGHRDNEELCRRSGLLQEYTTTSRRKSGEKKRATPTRGTETE
jgi:hypothetical protein